MNHGHKAEDSVFCHGEPPLAEMLADGIFGSLLASDHIPLSSLLRLIEETKEQINNKSR